jgi:two-component system chemotaxis sensor kinase CheA
MKGNCSIFHLESVAHAAHELESYLARSDDAVPPAHLVSELGSRWRAFVERVTRLIDTDPDGRVEVTREELDALLDASRARAPHTHIVDMLERLKYEEVEQRFHRVGQQACSLALRLGKPEPEISVDADQVRLPPTRWGAFWTAFVHVVRNAMDHGIESPEDREAAGKSREGHIRFAARTQDSELVLEISDDGRGIDWEGVRAAARSRGLPHGDRNALVAALFSSGLSTRTEVTQLSGRGIGMGAIRSACEGLGGRVEVESHKGLGTTLRFCFPLAQNRCSLPPPIPSRIADALEAQAG